MRERLSASCLALSALVSGVAKCASGIGRDVEMRLDERGRARHRDVRMDVDGGALRPRLAPGLPCLRAAVSAYLFQVSAISLVSVVVMRSPRHRPARGTLCHAMPPCADTSEHPQMLRRSTPSCSSFAGSNHGHAAGIEDDDVVGKVERELDVLLDQHDRQPLCLELRMVRQTSATICGASPRTARPSAARADCPSARGRSRASAARRRREPAIWLRALLQPRKQREHGVDASTARACCRRRGLRARPSGSRAR